MVWGKPQHPGIENYYLPPPIFEDKMREVQTTELWEVTSPISHLMKLPKFSRKNSK